MTLETEAVLDRRRLRRNMAFWRGLAVIGVIAAIGLAILGSQGVKSLIGTEQIARVSITGPITESRNQLSMLRKIAEADHVKAVLLYVNSPGGTTTGGEAIYQALRTISDKKPVVAQFGTVAASAGYIVGLGTDYIVARGNTITGSVGVIVQWPEVTELLGKLGIKMNEVKSGRLKAEPSPFKELDEAGRQATRNMVADSFKWFVSLVEKRRNIKVESVPGLAEGRIFSGREALNHKLIDRIGGEREAIDWLRKERGIAEGAEVVDWKPVEPGSWGVGAMIGQGLASLMGNEFGALAGLVSRDPRLSTLGLDGMVSVWHPAEK